MTAATSVFYKETMRTGGDETTRGQCCCTDRGTGLERANRGLGGRLGGHKNVAEFFGNLATRNDGSVSNDGDESVDVDTKVTESRGREGEREREGERGS